jgi:hypothetical protein
LDTKEFLRKQQETKTSEGYNLIRDGTLNGSFDAGLLEFGLIMQISEVIDTVYGQNSKRI